MPNSDAGPLPTFGAALAVYALGFLALAWPWLSGVVTIPWDAKSQFYPQQAFLARAIAAGEWPFWTSNVFAGWPQIADPQSLIFSPLHLLLATLDPTPGLRLFDAVTFVGLFFGGLGVLLLFRDRGWHPAGGLVAALALAFGGSCAARLQHTGEVLSTAYLMLAIWLLLRALERGSWKAGLAAGIVSAVMALGRDQVALLGLYLLAALVLTHWLAREGRWARVRSSLLPLALGGAAGAILLAWPMLMTALLAARSNRPAFGFAEAARGSMHPADLLTLVVPDLFGAADPKVDYWGPASIPWGFTDLFLAQNMGQLYIGILPLVAIVVGLLAGGLWRREIAFYALACLLLLLYALGWYTPFFRVAFGIMPGVTLFRRPADATFLFAAMLAILAGYCVHLWLSRAVRQKWPTLGGGALLLVLLAVAGATALAKDQWDVATAPLTLAAVWAAGALLALYAARRLPAAAALVVLAGFGVADLRLNNGPNESTGLPMAMYEVLRPATRNETVALLKSRLAATSAPDRRDRVELAGVGYHWPNLGLVHDLDHVFGHNPLRLETFAEATGVGDTVAAPDQRRFAPLFPSYRSAMADLFGLRFIASGVPVEKIDTTLTPGDLVFVARTADAYVYENPRALPRVMLLTDWREADAARLLRDGWPADVDPRRTVLLEHGRAPPAAAASAQGRATIRLYETTQVTVETDAPTTSVLLLNDVWHPWWGVRIDGKDAELLRANVLFRAVVVPPGQHQVSFTFHPVSGPLGEVAGSLRRR